MVIICTSVPLQAASDCFREVVKWVDALQYCSDTTEQIVADFAALKKVAVTNNVAIAQVLRSRSGGGEGRKEVEFNYELHSKHPKVVLVPAKVLKSV